jgi:hypothetical protein
MPDTELTPAAALAAAKTRADWLPVKGKTAEVSERDWIDYSNARIAAERWAAHVAATEARLREQAKDAQILTVNGVRVATRIITPVTGATFTKDYYRRTPGESSTSDD